VAQHGVEPTAVHRVDRLLAVAVQQRHSSLRVVGEPLQPLAGFRKHRR
jgi:hypothetical protein